MTKPAEWYQGKAGRAEHLVYLNKEAKELEKLIHGDKTMIIRGSRQKITFRRKSQNQRSCVFCETGGDLTITHRGIIANVIESEKMTKEESIDFVKRYEKELNLSKNKSIVGQGKYLAVYEIAELEEITPFQYNREKNMDDWVITDDINKIKL